MCTSEEFKNALSYKAQFYTDYGIPEVTKFKSGFGAYASNDNALFQGKIVFSIEGEWFENFINLYAPDDFEWGAVQVPVTEQSRRLQDADDFREAFSPFRPPARIQTLLLR